MSQITRCPSCGTTFKVVADQLRISEGWVRCGHCKEVFDASSHLQLAEPEHLLPEMPLDTLRSPPAPAPKMPEGVRVWGSARHASPRHASPAALEAGQASAAPVPQAESLVTKDVALPLAEERDTPPVPAFLATGALTESLVSTSEWTHEPASPFGWRSREPAAASLGSSPSVAVAEPTSSSGVPVERLASDLVTTDAEAQVAVQHIEPAAEAAAPPTPPEPDSGGYELPFAEMRDSGWPDDADAAGVDVDGVPSASLPLLDETGVEPVTSSPNDELYGPSVPDPGVRGGQDDPVPIDGRGPEAAILGAPSVAKALVPEGDDEDEAEPALAEPGFVRTARRKAFWRRPVVRGVLCFLVFLLLAVLALQAVLWERDRIAAMYPQMRPLLLAACKPLQCTLAAPRQITDVVIDSSSFTKGRGDSYQLLLTLKNRASMAVAMPAVELTLTDAQDQPVLRRVLHGDELAASTTLAAYGEWSGTLTLAVVAGAARVTGYRVLAFYP